MTTIASRLTEPAADGAPRMGALAAGLAPVSGGWALAYGAIALIQLALIWTHQPWLDELQAVLLARDTHALADWYWNFRYEGHAPLWHLVLKLALTAFEPITALRFVQSAFALATAWLIYTRAPFTPAGRLLLGLNYFFLFEYGVIARDYSLGVLLFLAIVAFRRRPVAWLLIALLPQAGAQGILLAGIGGVILLGAQGWSWRGAALSVLGVGLAMIWLSPAPDFQANNGLQVGMELSLRILRTLSVAGTTIFPIDAEGHLAGWNIVRIDFHMVLIPAGLVMPLLAAIVTRRTPLLALLTLLFIATTFALSVFVYGLSTRHFGLVVPLVAGCLWIDAERRGEGSFDLIAGTWMALLAMGGIGATVRSVAEPFATSRLVAQAVAAVADPDRLIIPIDTMLGVEVSAMLPRQTYNVTNQCLQTFVRWKGPVFAPPSIDPDETEAQRLDRARAALAVLKAATARAGGHALLLLDQGAAGLLAQVGDDPAFHFRRYLHVGGERSRFDRLLFDFDVPGDAAPAALPPCHS
jgi:hypothetical protein